MGSYILPARAYNPNMTGRSVLASPRDRNTFNTMINDDGEDTPRLIAQFPRPNILSPCLSEDFPTPRALPPQKSPRYPSQQQYISSPVSEVSTPSSVHASPDRQFDSSTFDELYDLTDDEAEEVPLRCSASVKKQSARSSTASGRGRYPSIIIPSPSTWPTIQKLKSAISPISPALGTPLKSPAANIMSMITARTLAVPNGSQTPSLDGSFTSEELDKLSCPSTPDLQKPQDRDEDWLPPPQLHPDALRTLNSLASSNSASSDSLASLVAEYSNAEMLQVGIEAPIDIVVTPVDNIGEDPLSALSIPSPGGFFSSLDSSARHTWSTAPTENVIPSTSVAEQFYGVPWRQSDKIVERVIEVPSSLMSGPSTAGITCITPGEPQEVAEINLNSSVRTEYDPKYFLDMQKTSEANLDRTGSWLTSQLSYMAALVETGPIDSTVESKPSSMRSRSSSLEDEITSPQSKKSVRFLDEVVSSPVSSLADIAEDEPEKETVLAEAFEFLAESSQKQDAYIQRQTRADAMHTMRRHMPTTHRNQLLGSYEISVVARPAPSRPVSSFYSDDPTILKEQIARAQKERQALEQVRPAAWALEAHKYLNGGSLLTKGAARLLSRTRNPRVLDVGGEAVCDWGWQVSHDFPHVTVHTATTQSAQSSSIAGPKNHKSTVIPNYWTFPFPSNHFDVISARSLYALLHTNKPTGSRIDELDLCLKECLRCLKPGGYLEYNVLDADIMHAGPLAHAKSVEFGFNLQTRGYDPAPTKTFLPRLNRAGFADVKRAWTFMPMGQTAARWTDIVNVGADALDKAITAEGEVVSPAGGSTKDIEAMSGLVGAWAWERWLIKLQVEMGKTEDKQLEGVPAVLEEGPKTGAGWRILNGCARKPF